MKIEALETNVMTDIILEAIQRGTINTENISFSKIRETGGKNRDLWGELGRGRAILSSHDQLDQYLYSYGPMIRSQWEAVFSGLKSFSHSWRLVDYGCGQGLASALLFDFVDEKAMAQVSAATLIEPSGVALARAAAIVNCYSPKISVAVVLKKFDELNANDVAGTAGIDNIHLFSNVLDIPGFKHLNLFTKIFKTTGRHIILAVSHNRDFDGGTERFRQLERAISDPKHSEWFTVKTSNVDEFICAGDKPAVSWNLEVEVLRGSF